MNCKIEMRSSHFIIPPEIASVILGDTSCVYASFKKDLGVMLISPIENSWFPKLHQSFELLVKVKDLKGTRSVAVTELLIDNEIDQSNKILDAQMNNEKKILRVEISKVRK